MWAFLLALVDKKPFSRHFLQAERTLRCTARSAEGVIAAGMPRGRGERWVLSWVHLCACDAPWGGGGGGTPGVSARSGRATSAAAAPQYLSPQEVQINPTLLPLMGDASDPEASRLFLLAPAPPMSTQPQLLVTATHSSNRVPTHQRQEGGLLRACRRRRRQQRCFCQDRRRRHRRACRRGRRRRP